MSQLIIWILLDDFAFKILCVQSSLHRLKVGVIFARQMSILYSLAWQYYSCKNNMCGSMYIM